MTPMTSNPSQKIQHLTLPWPPAINDYWNPVPARSRHSLKPYARLILSARGKAYRTEVGWLCQQARWLQRPYAAPVAVFIRAFPPDRRRHDLDNLPKPVLDALQHQGVLRDDCDVARLTIERWQVITPGFICVWIETITEEPRYAEKTVPAR